MDTSTKEYFFVNDKTDQTYFTAVVFPQALTAVVFPADPNERALSDWDSPARRDKIAAVASEEKGLKILWRKWRYYEVSPYPEQLLIRKYEVGLVRNLLSGGHTDGSEAEASAPEMEKLDALAKAAGLPTIGEYYTQICEERKTTGSLAEAAHAMVSVWTHEWPSTAALLAQLKNDLAHRMYLVNHYKHGWYYIVKRGEQEEFFRTKNTETLLRSFILHAEEAEKKGQKIRFVYCMREYMPAGIDWKQSPFNPLVDCSIATK